MAGNSRVYSVFLHGVLVALAICSLLLVRQNQLLSDRLDQQGQQSAFQIGESLTPFEVLTTNSLTTDSQAPSSHVADNSLRLIDLGASERPRLLFFFNTSCGACRANQAPWRELYLALADSTEVIGVSLDSPESTLAYVDQMELPFPTVSAVNPESLAQTLGLTRIPETVLVDTQGKVADAWLGVLTDDDLQELGLES